MWSPFFNAWWWFCGHGRYTMVPYDGTHANTLTSCANTHVSTPILMSSHGLSGPFGGVRKIVESAPHMRFRLHIAGFDIRSFETHLNTST